MVQSELDYGFLSLAVDRAGELLLNDIAPVVAMLVYENNIMAISFSQRDVVNGKRETNRLGHAEFNLLTNYSLSLSGLTLYTTIEPCLMCMSLMIVGSGRVKRVVWALDDLWGGFTKTYNFENDYIRTHLPDIVSSPFEDLRLRALYLWQEYINKIHNDDEALRQFYIKKVLG